MSLELLWERYPEIAFFLAYTPFEPKEESRWQQLPDLERVEILYVYGVAKGAPYLALRTWLQARRERRLIFLEDDLSAIAALMQEPGAEDLLRDAQVHLEFLQDSSAWKEILERLIWRFPSDYVEFLSLKRKAPRAMRLFLLRRTSASVAALAELLEPDRLLTNLLSNFRRLSRAFDANQLGGKFSGIPVLICGAGPSLAASLKQLKTLENRALIIGCGSALTILKKSGIRPHLGLAVDPNPEEYARLKESADGAFPLLFAGRLHADVLGLPFGALGYLRTQTGGPCEAWLEEKLGISGAPIGPELGSEALSVTTLALALAHHFGGSPILFTGVDLGFSGMQRYAEGVLEGNALFLQEQRREKKAAEQLIRRKDRQGRTLYTLTKWVMEAAVIGRYAKSHPDRLFVNCSETGMAFPGVPYMPLEEAIEKYCTASYPLREKIRAEAQRLSFSSRIPLALEEHLQELRQSLQRSLNIAQQMRAQLPLGRETGKMVLLQSDFEEELAFSCLLQQTGVAFERLLGRHYGPEACALAKWAHFEKILHNAMRCIG